jgi:hypothetical protein
MEVNIHVQPAPATLGTWNISDICAPLPAVRYEGIKLLLLLLLLLLIYCCDGTLMLSSN